MILSLECCHRFLLIVILNIPVVGAGTMNNNRPGAPRLPTHKDLVALTQSILHKALLKQELEKSKEVILHDLLIIIFLTLLC